MLNGILGLACLYDRTDLSLLGTIMTQLLKNKLKDQWEKVLSLIATKNTPSILRYTQTQIEPHSNQSTSSPTISLHI